MKSAETPNDRVVRAKFSSRGMATGLGAPSAMSTEEGVRMDFRAAGRVGWWLARAKRLVPLIEGRARLLQKQTDGPWSPCPFSTLHGPSRAVQSNLDEPVILVMTNHSNMMTT